ncbi:MAG: hypothetical protein WA120_02870 [Candidatus Hydromicrobium sp.]
MTTWRYFNLKEKGHHLENMIAVMSCPRSPPGRDRHPYTDTKIKL